MSVLDLNDVQDQESISVKEAKFQFFASGTGEISLECRPKGSSTWIPAANTITAPDVMTDSFSKCDVRFTVPGTAELAITSFKNSFYDLG